MATITEDYVSFETAELLKDKGMDVSCFNYYTQKNNNDGTSEAVTVCTLQMAMKWLREVHNVAIVIAPSMFWGRYNISIYKKGNDYPYGFDGGDLVPSYEQGCENAIKYCLENLI